MESVRLLRLITEEMENHGDGARNIREESGAAAAPDEVPSAFRTLRY